MDSKINNIMPDDGKMPNSSVIYSDLCNIIERGRQASFSAVNQSAIATYWNIEKRIVDEEQQGCERNLDYYRKFYICFPDWQIVNARVHNLEWTHVRRILSVSNPDAQLLYLL